MYLSTFGWDPSLQKSFESHTARGWVPARVIREDRGRYIVFCEEGEKMAEVRGRFRREAAASSAFPAVGDWVALAPSPGGSRAAITLLLPRKGAFVRTVAGPRSRAQVVAANVDTAFLVTGLDANFRLRRIERLLTLAHAGGTAPVVVLNKSDLCSDIALRVRQVEGVAPGAPVLAVSATKGEGIEEIRAHLGPGRTGAFLGSSGVGKSTLINRLLGAETLATNDVRAADNRGRHTTTRRELLVLPKDAGVVIDTPGIRELQLCGDADEALKTFGDVEEAAASCRFRDCRHQGEPGCGVQSALQEGDLDTERYESFLEQRRELAYQQRRHDQGARQAEQAKWRRITIEQRKRRNSRRDER